MSAVFYTRRLDYVADFYIVRARHFTPLAIEAVFKSLVVEKRFLQAVSLPVGTCLLRPRIVGVYGSDRAIDGAYRALYTRFEIVVAYILLL